MTSNITGALGKVCATIATTFLLFAATAQAATMSFGPSPYLQTGGLDTPAGFFDFGPGSQIAWIEDFEANGTIDPFLTISPGGVLAPNSSSGLGAPITDSVDADDGTIDGNGNNGYSYFADGVRSLTIEYMTGVRAAGVVFTDGDSRSTNIRLEAFDTMGNLLGTIDAGDLADDMFTGQTAEDRFLGFTDDMTPIGSITLSMDAGIGIEIDHVHWQTPTVPEPSSQCLALFALIGLVQLRRVRR